MLSSLRAAVVALALGNAASASIASVGFLPLLGTGTTDANIVSNDGRPIAQGTINGGSFSATASGASGGTGGGIGDGAIPVASLDLRLNASSTQERGGSPAFRVRATVTGVARFLNPQNYTGSISCAVLLDSPFAVNLSQSFYYTGTAPLRNLATGDFAFPNTTLMAGDYSILPRSTPFALRATNLNPLDTYNLYYEGFFTVPAPAAAPALAGLALAAHAGRRRPRAVLR